jgi:hypothetical protein
MDQHLSNLAGRGEFFDTLETLPLVAIRINGMILAGDV